MSLDEHTNRMLDGIMEDIADMKKRLADVTRAADEARAMARDASRIAEHADSSVVRLEESVRSVVSNTTNTTVKLSVLEACVSGIDKILTKNVSAMEGMQKVLSEFGQKLSNAALQTGITWSLLVVIIIGLLTLAWKIIEKGYV